MNKRWREVRQGVTRRSMLVGLGAGAGGILAAACGQQANSQESVQTLQYLLDLMTRGDLQPPADGFQGQAVDFASGHSAIHYGGFQQAIGLLQKNPALKLGTLPVPYGPTPAKVTGSAGEAMSIWGSSKHPDAACKFVRYLCYEKNLQWSKDYFVIPVRQADLSDPFYKSDLLAPVVETLQTHAYLKWQYDLGNNFPHAPDLIQPLNEGLNAAVKGQLTARAAMDNVVVAQNDLLRRYAAALQQFLTAPKEITGRGRG